MEIIRFFNSPKSQEKLTEFITQYFKTNGYYKVQAKDGLKFSNSAQDDTGFSPKRFNIDTIISYTKQGELTKVDARIKVKGWEKHIVPTENDKEYFNAFIGHFEVAMKEWEVSKFDGSAYIQQSKTFWKPYAIIVLIATAFAFLLTWLNPILFGGYEVIIIIIIALAWGPSLANRWVKRQEKKTKLA